MPAKASPAALVTACCSAIPTSMVRSGNLSANLSKPVGPNMAAVIAISFGLLSPCFTNSSAKTLVQVVTPFASGRPVSGSTMPTAWNFSASSSIAGA